MEQVTGRGHQITVRIGVQVRTIKRDPLSAVGVTDAGLNGGEVDVLRILADGEGISEIDKRRTLRHRWEPAPPR